MREILFKAKTKVIADCYYNNGKDDGEWVKGYLYNDIGCWKIKQFDISRADYVNYEVDPETICQYTGLTDKNGNKIWENDIVKYTDDLINKEKTVLIEFNETHASFVRLYKSKMGLQYLYINESIANNCEIIGNIFDNPELLDADKQASKYADNDVMKSAT